MPISESFLESDKKAYRISSMLDERMKEFYNERAVLVKKSEKSLKDILILCTRLNEIFGGFDNPPREIMEEISEDGSAELKKYYSKIRQEFMNKSGIKLILGYEAIRLANEFLKGIPKYLFSIEEMQLSNFTLAEVEMSYLSLQEEKRLYKNLLLKSKNLTPNERMFLFTRLEAEIEELVVTRIVQNYTSKLCSKIQKDIGEFCITNLIPLKTSDLNKKIMISYEIFRQIKLAKNILTQKFNNHSNLSIKILNDEQKKLEAAFLVTALDEPEINNIINLINDLISNISKAQNKSDISKLTGNIQNNYKGHYQKEVVEWIRLLNQEILKNGFSQNIVDNYKLGIKNAD